MKVTLEKFGGFAAALKRPVQSADTADLDKSAAEQLAQLVAAARAAPESEPNQLARDAMHYTVTVTDGGETTVLSQGDTGMSAPFAELKNWLERHGAHK